MAGIIVELIISWLLLKFILHQNLLVLRFKINSKQLNHIIIALFIPVIFLVIHLVSISLWVKSPYHLNPNYTFAAFKNSAWYVLISVWGVDISRSATIHIDQKNRYSKSSAGICNKFWHLSLVYNGGIRPGSANAVRFYYYSYYGICICIVL